MHFKIYLISQISFSIFFKICLILCRKYAPYLNYSYKNEYAVKSPVVCGLIIHNEMF